MDNSSSPHTEEVMAKTETTRQKMETIGHGSGRFLFIITTIITTIAMVVIAVAGLITVAVLSR